MIDWDTVLNELPPEYFDVIVARTERQIGHVESMLGRRLTRREQDRVIDGLFAQAEGGDELDGQAAYWEAHPDGDPYDRSTYYGRVELAKQRMQDAEDEQRETEAAEKAEKAEREASGESEPEHWAAKYDRTTYEGRDGFAREAAKRIEESERERRVGGVEETAA